MTHFSLFECMWKPENITICTMSFDFMQQFLPPWHDISLKVSVLEDGYVASLFTVMVENPGLSKTIVCAHFNYISCVCCHFIIS